MDCPNGNTICVPQTLMTCSPCKRETQMDKLETFANTPDGYGRYPTDEDCAVFETYLKR